ncbi:hypothetical protein H257_01128 [Aphanomyces astaci]|uniref:Ubiquitin-like domain-containing protein n=2 Tax=Aphanomyces astaci TaxID=112090 RepID=W4H7T8_APHAT|nr:hypothetical protein H257_01128 [Aphanomyces astaci]ETV87621.1 hypothetical protein H257_01128 [Aphanomyces astaci]|eukprot:XP_009822484.1 hypothetical protein H257_01128 [Aphanomyces astaci]
MPTAATPAYGRVLSEADRLKVDALEKRMKKLDDTVHIWVRDGGNAREGATPREFFSMKLRPALPVSEIRDQIQERYERDGYYTSGVDPPLRLLFGGKLLVDGHKFVDYLPLPPPQSHPRLKWVKPYAGIMWVIPIQIEPRFATAWGDYITPHPLTETQRT